MNSSRLSFQKKLLNFQHSFKKVQLTKKICKIRKCYKILKNFCRENHSLCRIKYESGSFASVCSVSIQILSKNILISDEIPDVQWLFQNANLIEISAQHGLLLTELWFCCWKLEPVGTRESFLYTTKKS